ncbi:MAG: hypothetical protein IJY28_02890 [Clostridia bacterium]|nr:hypothetical protein [Clostridia bacterium]
MPHDSFDDLIHRYRQELLRYQSRNPAAVPSAVAPAPAPVPAPPAPVPAPPVSEEPPAAAPVPPPLPMLEELMQCRDGYTHSGTLRVAVTTARQAVPLPDADVTIFCMQDGRRHLKYFLTTDASGRTPAVLLPAPPPINSGEPNNRFPFALYGVSVYKPGFLPAQEPQVRVFSDVTGTVAFDLIPGDVPPVSPVEGG